MDFDRLIEPLGIIYGGAARDAVNAGFAHWLAGGTAAFSMARLIVGQERRIVPAGDIPASWHDILDRVTRAPPMAGLPAGAMVMGIVNATPDSFSDAGAYFAEGKAMAHAQRLMDEGAHILDIGGESTRPGSIQPESAEEWRRISPVIEGLKSRQHAPLVSVDTRSAAVMDAALAMGVDVINDVSALQHDRDAIAVLAPRDCSVVLMHMRGTPDTMTSLTDYHDVAVDTVRELALAVGAAVHGGIAPERIIIDPGIGFAKDTTQNFELLARLPIFANLGCRMLLGTSRKRFIGAATDVKIAAERGPGTIVSSLPGLTFPGTLVRVHEVAPMVQALRVWQAMHA